MWLIESVRRRPGAVELAATMLAMSLVGSGAALAETTDYPTNVSLARTVEGRYENREIKSGRMIWS